MFTDRSLLPAVAGLRPCVIAVLLMAATLLCGGAGEDVAIASIPAFHKLFGVPPGQPDRPVHTAGTVAAGVFIPSPAAASVSHAQHLTGGPVPVIVRLSTFSGAPGSPDAGPLAAPRGMAIKFLLGDDLDTDIVAHSYNGFPAATPQDFVAFLGALAAGNGNATPGEGPLDRFLALHPAAQTFVQAPKPAPASWSNETFFGVNAFAFVDPAGRRRYGRYSIVPDAGDHRLSAAESQVAAPGYLPAMLAAELARGPVSWRVLVQLAEPGDRIDDGSVAWPASRDMVALGVLRLDRLVADSGAAERELVFNPLNLVPGIEPSNDPMLAARSRAYGESYRLRSR